jgi:hypothetical protein
MRTLESVRALAFLACLLAGAARAEDARPGVVGGARRPDVDVVVPVDPHEHERLHWFDGQPHHLLPGTVTIGKAPYVCDVHRRRFSSEDAFVAHLRLVHHLPPERIPGAVVLTGGQVHFGGD